MVGATCEIEPLRFPQNSFFSYYMEDIHYLMFHFLIWTYNRNDLQFLEL